MLAVVLVALGPTDDGDVVRFRGPTCEDHLVGLRANCVRNRVSFHDLEQGEPVSFS